MKGYRLMDLISETNITFAQFRRWREAEIIPPAVRAGKYSYYPVEALSCIKRAIDLKARNMTLADIRDHLHPPDDA